MLHPSGVAGLATFAGGVLAAICLYLGSLPGRHRRCRDRLAGLMPHDRVRAWCGPRRRRSDRGRDRVLDALRRGSSRISSPYTAGGLRLDARRARRDRLRGPLRALGGVVGTVAAIIVFVLGNAVTFSLELPGQRRAGAARSTTSSTPASSPARATRSPPGAFPSFPSRRNNDPDALVGPAGDRRRLLRHDVGAAKGSGKPVTAGYFSSTGCSSLLDLYS